MAKKDPANEAAIKQSRRLAVIDATWEDLLRRLHRQLPTTKRETHQYLLQLAERQVHMDQEKE